ncbi:MAG: lipopolysaccharide biosynthesis protein [Alphaproteobacteria bacterium]
MIEQGPARRPPMIGAAVATLRRWLAEGTLRRVFRNAGVLLGGKAVAGLFGLGALALTARALGPEVFGVLILVHTYVKLIGGLTKFQSWQTVIHFGARCLDEQRKGDFRRLIAFTFLLDGASALVGAAVAVAFAALAAGWLGWGDDTVPLAVAYSALLLVTIKATPVGILRLFDRFDLLSVQSAVSPAVRLAGAGIAYAVGGGLEAFLIVWFLSGAADGVTLLALSWREFGRRGLRDGFFSIRGSLVAPFPGLWRFAWTANLNSAVTTVGEHLSTLVVGWVLGPAPAGLYKIAGRYAHALATPAGLLRRTVYPELAKLSARGGVKASRKVVLRAGLIAGSVALAVLVLLVPLGEPLLRITVGEAYVGAYGVLLLLTLATAVLVFGFALEPALYAMGRPDLLLRISLIMVLVNIPLLYGLLLWLGLIGAGIAAVAGAVTWFGVLVMVAMRGWRAAT